MDKCNSCTTPLPIDCKLKSRLEQENNQDSINSGMYQRIIGKLLYLSMGTRSDITYAVSTLSRFCSDPSSEQYVRHLLRYLRGKTDYGICYENSNDKGVLVNSFSDADYGGDLLERLSTSGYIFKVNNCLISWK